MGGGGVYAKDSDSLDLCEMAIKCSKIWRSINWSAFGKEESWKIGRRQKKILWHRELSEPNTPRSRCPG